MFMHTPRTIFFPNRMASVELMAKCTILPKANCVFDCTFSHETHDWRTGLWEDLPYRCSPKSVKNKEITGMNLFKPPIKLWISLCQLSRKLDLSGRTVCRNLIQDASVLIRNTIPEFAMRVRERTLKKGARFHCSLAENRKGFLLP